MTAIAKFFAKQPFKYATPRGLHTEWFKITKPGMMDELKKITGIEIENGQCRVSRYFERTIITERELK